MKLNRKERRKQERVAKKMEKQNRKHIGTHFIRTATEEQLARGVDARLYKDMQGNPFTEETATEAFKVLVDYTDKMSTNKMAVQLYTKTLELVDEELGLLYGAKRGQKPGVMLDHKSFQDIMDTLAKNDIAFVECKYKQQTPVRMYNGKPHEFLSGLPLRHIASIRNVRPDEVVLNANGPLAPFFREARARGLSVEASVTEAMAKFKASN